MKDSQPCRIDWLKFTVQEKEDYYLESKKLLNQLQLSTEAKPTHSQNYNCADEKHLEEIEILMQS